MLTRDLRAAPWLRDPLVGPLVIEETVCAPDALARAYSVSCRTNSSLVADNARLRRCRIQADRLLIVQVRAAMGPGWLNRAARR
jgi:hypothetical protein